MRSPLRYLSARLFLLLLGVMLIVFSVHTYMDIRTTSRNLTEEVYASAERASDLIARSTRYSMLLNRKADVHQTIHTLGSEPGFVEINIYNKSGETIFSTDSLLIGTEVDLDAEACNICHAAGQALVSVPATSRMRVYESSTQGHVLGLINPIPNEKACSSAACHAHSPEQSVLGVLDVKMSLASVDLRVAQMRNKMIVSSIIMTLLIAGVSGLFIYRVIRNPIKRLKAGMTTISSGNLDTEIPVDTSMEIGELALYFNNMAKDLRKAREESRQWSQKLEERVASKTEELQRVQKQVIHMEKMASLGKLSASVAHEINNPLFGILTYAKLCLRDLAEGSYDTTTFKRQLEAIQSESSRCGEIVKNLLDFARQTGGEFKPHHVNETVDQVLFLLNHHLQMKSIDVKRELTEEDDVIVCDAKQLQQALIAPCMNAIEAMPNGGTLTISTSGVDGRVAITISDTGSGIPEDVLPNVFEPFFTTKEGESGLGLGLSVVYGIVQRHKGTIKIDSTVNEGTAFTIVLPRNPAGSDAAPMQSEQTPGHGAAS